MADKLTPLIVDALARAAAEPAGAPLFASKSEAGLFPNTSAAKPAAKKCLDDGLLQLARTDVSGRTSRELYAATDKGVNYLVEHASPKQVIDDFVRLLEERRCEARQLLETAKRMAESVEGMMGVVNRMASRVSDDAGSVQNPTLHRVGSPEKPDLPALLLAALNRWTVSAGVARDCPLPDLFRALAPTPTVGEFHDALRALHAAGRIYLHPWTGPLYALPEPPFALMVGHEIAFYASPR